MIAGKRDALLGGHNTLNRVNNLHDPTLSATLSAADAVRYVRYINTLSVNRRELGKLNL